MKHWLWTLSVFLVDYIKADDQIAMVLQEEWLSRNLAEGELREFYEVDAISEHHIQTLLEEKKVLTRKYNFTIIRGLLKNENNTEILLPTDLQKFVLFFSSQFHNKVFDKRDSNQIQIINQTDLGFKSEVEFSLLAPWQGLPNPDLSPKQKSKLYIKEIKLLSDLVLGTDVHKFEEKNLTEYFGNMTLINFIHEDFCRVAIENSVFKGHH